MREQSYPRDNPNRVSVRRRFAAGVLALSPFMFAACGPSDNVEATHTSSVEAPVTTTQPEIKTEQDQEFKVTASKVISTFENSTTEIQYDYAENIDDGRGITAGRAGFTSGTGDLLEVVQGYTEVAPGNVLEKYLPALEKVNGTDSTEGLEGFIEAWAEAVNSDDEVLRNIQDKVVDELYYDPAMRYAAEVGVESPLGKSILFDTIIQHGEGEDPDGLPAIVQEAVSKAGNVNGNELEWLEKFLDIRQHHLENAADPATRQGWLDSVDRVLVWRKFATEKNLELTPPLKWEVYGDEFELTEE